MNKIVNLSNQFKKTRFLVILLTVLLLPQGVWSQTLTKTYTFTSSTPTVINEEGITMGGTLECNGVNTWELSGESQINNDREISISGSGTSSPELTSVDHFYMVSKITVNVTLPETNPDQPSIRLACNGQTANATGSGNQDAVFSFDEKPYYPNGFLSIGIDFVFPYSFTLNSITVEYEKYDINLKYRTMDGGPVTTYSIDWREREQSNLPEADPNTGDYISGRITYSSSDESVATVDESGDVSFVSPGTTTIKASYPGYSEMYAATSAQYVLTIVDDRYEPDFSYSAATAEVTYGSAISLPTLENPDQFPVTYKSSNTNVATVDGKGNVTLVLPGQTTISAKFESNEDYKGKTVSYVLTYYAKTLTEDMVYVVQESVSFNGTYQIPTVTVKDGTTFLVEGTDYTLENPGGKLAGEYPVTVTGKGNYTGTVYKTFTITDTTPKYNIWINGNQVSKANCKDVLSDSVPGQKPASFIYNPQNNYLIVNSNQGYRIETKINTGLTIYLAPKSESRVSRIIYSGDDNTNATLTFTTDGNNPGRLILDNTLNQTFSPVISGFGQLVLDEKQNVSIISPENISYQDHQLFANSAIIGVPMSPITKETSIQPNGAEIVPEAGESDINKVVDNILYTLGDTNESDGDGFDDGGFVVINSVTSDHEAAGAVKDYTPGTTDFMEHLKGMTFMVPAGNGNIKLNIQTMDAHILKVKIGDAVPVSIQKTERGDEEIPYNVGEPTYVYLYNGGPASTGARSKAIAKGGKKTVTHIRVYKIGVNPSKVNASNPVGEASGGAYTGDTSDMEGQEIMSGEDIKAAMGDVNGDGMKSAADIVEVAKAIIGMHSGVYNETYADMNGDGVINICDIIQILSKIK